MKNAHKDAEAKHTQSVVDSLSSAQKIDDNFPFDEKNVGAKKEATTVKSPTGEAIKVTKTSLQEKVRPEDDEKKMRDAKKNLLVSNPKPGAKPKAQSAQEKQAE